MNKHPITPDMTIRVRNPESMNTFITWTDPFQSEADRGNWTSVCYGVQENTVSDGIGG